MTAPTAPATATLSFQRWLAQRCHFPSLPGTDRPRCHRHSKPLYAKSGKFTYDPGFMSTAACRSAITYIDGDKGELLYRGYPIEQIRGPTATYLETLLLAAQR